MKGILSAVAIALTGAISLSAYAQIPGQTTPPQAAPAPASAPPPQASAGEREGGGGPWMHGRGGWGMPGGPMMHREMWRHGMRGWDPKEHCIDRLAWRAARRAFVEAKLNLNADQRPLWDKLEGIARSEQQRERQLCDQLKPNADMTALDRMDRAQQFLSTRLEALQAAKPAVQALYQSLNPDQKEIFDHPFRPE